MRKLPGKKNQRLVHAWVRVGASLEAVWAMLTDYKDLAEMADLNLKNIGIVILAVGVIMAIVAFLGCYGACCENVCALKIVSTSGKETFSETCTYPKVPTSCNSFSSRSTPS